MFEMAACHNDILQAELGKLPNRKLPLEVRQTLLKT